ncbi:MAG: YabP/YqfC family sporulation protein [Ruminococcus callidus]
MLWIRIDFVEVMFMENRLIQAGRRVLQLETHLEMHSDREIFIENCRRILEYNDIRIVLQTTDLVLEIWGSELQTDSRSPKARIHGKIQSITLTPKGHAMEQHLRESIWQQPAENCMHLSTPCRRGVLPETALLGKHISVSLTQIIKTGGTGIGKRVQLLNRHLPHSAKLVPKPFPVWVPLFCLRGLLFYGSNIVMQIEVIADDTISTSRSQRF